MPKAIDKTWTVDERGHLPRSAREHIAGQLKLYAGRDVRVRLSRPKRTTKANAYYWSQIIEPIRIALLEAGQPAPAEAIHEVMKRRYLEPRTTTVFDEEHWMPPTTTDLDQTDFSDYIENVKHDEDVIALGVYIPDPDGDFRSYRLAEPA